ncbi:MAG: type III secretion system chaperone [Gammaproteobacteria bacterium]
MDNARIAAVIERLGIEAVGAAGQWRLVVDGRALMIITDEKHDRMRIMGHVTAAEALDEALLTRTMQANFDTALDARYAIARNTLWSVFVHPLSTLSERDFLLGLGQVVNLANTFGSSYSSGLLSFGGGDSGAIRERELLDELLEKGQAI